MSTETLSTGPGERSPVPNGHDTGPSYTVTDERSAGEALNGLLFDLPDGADGGDTGEDQTPSREQEQPRDTGADEPPTGEQDEEQGEQPPPAAIAPPASWPADDQAAFAKLPPDLQQIVARRESQREAALTQRSQEAAEARRQFDGERQAGLVQRQDFLASLQKMLLMVAPEYQQLQGVDWQAVAARSPSEHAQLQALERSMRERLQTVEQVYTYAQQQQAQAQQQALAQALDEQRVLLGKAIPDFADEARAPTMRRELGIWLRDVAGFSPQEIAQAYDHRLVVMAVKAMAYDRQQAAGQTANQKRLNPPPRVQRPGTASSDEDRGGRRINERVRQLGRTNSVRDAGSLIAEILS